MDPSETRLRGAFEGWLSERGFIASVDETDAAVASGMTACYSGAALATALDVAKAAFLVPVPLLRTIELDDAAAENALMTLAPTATP